MLSSLSALFERDLNKLMNEISLYRNEADLWKISDGISNSGGNLTLHLIGNLNHFIGAILGNTGYVRDRDKEFSLKSIAISQLIDDLKNTSGVITNTLTALSQDDLEKDFPVAIGGEISSTSFILLHLLSHLSYHLGQINYHRRLVV